VDASRNDKRVALRRFIDDGRLPAHNNISELNLSRQIYGAERRLAMTGQTERMRS
jgi:hypothetical protein